MITRNKRIISMLLLFCMVITAVPVQAFTTELNTQPQLTQEASNLFSDMNKSDWYYDSVMYAYENGLFNGTSKTTFSPDGTMTRAMYVTIMGRMAEINTNDYNKAPEFTDVPTDSYYASYVRWAMEKGITSGIGKGLFDPDGFVTRQQMAVLMVRFFDAYGIKYPDKTNNTTPADIGYVADWAKDAVMKLWACGLFVGDNKGNFNPESNVKRSEAAALCKRTDETVEKWFVETGIKTAPDKQEEKPGDYNKPNSGTGSNNSSTASITFLDGSRTIETIKTAKGKALGNIPSVDKTSKEGYVFEGWYVDSSFSTPFYADDIVTASKTVYAKYTALPQPELTLTSFALLNKDADLTFEVVADSTETADIDSAVTLIPKDGSEALPLKISESNGVYTIGAENGFNPGSSYELTLKEGYNFKGKAASIRTASFTIYKKEVANLEFSDDIVYIKDTETISYTIGENKHDVLETKYLTSEDNEALTGVFEYDNAANLKEDMILCFYVDENPKYRDYINMDYSNDPEVYVKVVDVDEINKTVAFSPLENEDMKQLYFMPDTFPMKVDFLPEQSSGTINLSALDMDAFAEMGKNPDNAEDMTVNEGDFVAIYEYSEKLSSENDIYYGKITAYNTDTRDITYTQTTLSEIEQSMELFLSQTVSGEALLQDVDKDALKAAIKEQVEESGFAQDAAFLLAELATKTNGFQRLDNVHDILITDEDGKTLSHDEIALLGIGGAFELTDKIRTTVEIETDKNKLHLGDGVRVAIGIDATFSVDVGDEGDSIKIDLSATFVEEFAMGTDIKADVKRKKALGFIPYIKGLKIDAALDLKNYTAISVFVNVYTVAAEDESTWDKLNDLLGGDYNEVFDKIQELESRIEQAKGTYEQIKGYEDELAEAWKSVPGNVASPDEWKEMGQTLYKMDVTKDLMGLLNLTNETELDAGVMDLIGKYNEMMQNESDWITLVRAEIFSYEYCIYGVAVGVSADFVVRGNINIALGTNLEYQVGKRYVFWIDVFKAKAGSSTMDLLDEQFAFQFYVMGKLGLKMGVSARIFMGIGSGKLASVGLNTEFGPYIKLYGMFIYEYSQLRPANTNTWIYDERMAGAMYLDFGLYFIVSFDAQALKSLLEYRKEFVNSEIPLLTAGGRIFNYDFATELQDDEVLRIQDEDSNSTNGVTMTLPESYRSMSQLDLVDGSLKNNIYKYDKYILSMSNRNFSIDKDGKISVNVPEGTQYMTCDLTITWKTNKLAFTNKDITITIPLVWTNLSDSELKEYFTASVRVGNDTDGYTTVWQKRVKKNEPFDLPDENEIKARIDYDSYETESGNNLKYAGLSGYKKPETENLKIYTDTVYDFNVSYKEYEITVHGVQNVDGTEQRCTFKAKYGDTFDFDVLKDTGTNLPNDDTEKAKFTRFLNLSYEGGEITEPIGIKLAKQLEGGSAVAQANYADASVLATFIFEGIEVEPVKMKIRSGTQPDFNYRVVAEKSQAIVEKISPVISKIYENTDYVISCKMNDGSLNYDITFDSNGGSEVEKATYPEGSAITQPIDPIKEGYSFRGWYSDSALSTQFIWDAMPNKNIILYAKWSANSYTVTLDSNGGEFTNGVTTGSAIGTNTATVTVTFGNGYGNLPKPVRTGLNFAGWYKDSQDGEPVYSDTPVSVARDHTLYARWSDQIVIDPARVMLSGLDGLVYDGNAKKISVTSGSGINADFFTVQYKRNDAAEWSDEAVNAGLYSVKVYVDTNVHTEYAPFEKTFFDVMTIAKAPSVLNKQTYNPLPYKIVGRDNVTVKKFEQGVDYIGDGIIEYAVFIFDTDQKNIKWQTSNKFVNLNQDGSNKEYIISARISEGENYLANEMAVREQRKGWLAKYWYLFVEKFTLQPSTEYKLDVDNGYTYKVRIKTSDIYKAGTDAKIYAIMTSDWLKIYQLENKEVYRLDNSKNNDFERGNLDEFELITSSNTYNPFNPMLPMTFELYYVKDGSSAGWHCDWIEVDIYKDGVYLQTSDRITVNDWFEDSTKSFMTKVQFKRSITSTGNFDENSKSLVLSAGTNEGAYELIYNGNATDQFRAEDYNAFEHRYSPVMDITAAGYEDCFTSEVDRIAIDKKALYDKMVKNNCYVLDITVTLTFDDSVTTDTTKKWSKVINVTRPIIE